jgi:molybdopterin converting factor small subunit
MSITVHVPIPLQRFTQGQAEVSAQGRTVGAVLADVEKQYPAMRDGLRYEDGSLKRFVNIYLNDDDIRTEKGELTKTRKGDRISIVPAIAGGAAGAYSAM